MSEMIDVEIKKSILIRGSREKIYDAFSTAEGLDGWFTSGAAVDARPGGVLRFRWKDWGPDKVTAQDDCPILQAKRPEQFVFQEHPDSASPPTTVEIDFIPDPAGTVVRLREYGFVNTPTGRRALVTQAGGWGEALALLKFYVEHGLRY